MKRLKPMSAIERAFWALTDFEKQIKLLKQDLYAELPKRRIRTGAYFIDHEGKRQYYLRKPKKVANEKA